MPAKVGSQTLIHLEKLFISVAEQVLKGEDGWEGLHLDQARGIRAIRLLHQSKVSCHEVRMRGG